MGNLRKTVLACSLLAGMLCLMTLQKTSLFMALRIVLHPTVSMEQGYAVLSVLIVAPYMFSVFLMIWNIPFLRKAKDFSLPSLKSIFLGVFAAVVEAVCVVTFTTRVMAILPVYVALPATYGVLAISAVIASLHRTKKESSKDSSSNEPASKAQGEKSHFCGGARITASVLCMLVSPAVACFLYIMSLSDIVTSLALALVPSLLGLIWTPELQSQVLDPSGSNPLCHKRFRVLYGVIKIVTVFLFIWLEMYFRSDVSHTEHLLDRFYDGFSIFNDTYVMVPIAIHFLSSLFGFGLAYASLAMCQPLFGIVIPSLLSMVVSIVLCVSLAPVMYGIDETSHFGSFAIYLICASILAWAWAWPYILNSSAFLRKPTHLLTPYKVLFRSYGWNSIFNDSRLLLGYESRHPLDKVTSSPKVKNRIYICTTMYREADYEMERLLMSLVQISSDPLLEDVHFEGNIFMDNGCSGETLNEFALQFIALLVSKVGVSLDRARCWLTPYGMQIFCQLPSGLPLFVHLKDPKKVKPKKRWSQSMYINYVMKFRKALWQNDSENTQLFTIQTVKDKMSKSDQNPDEINFVGDNEQFVLRRIDNIGYPTLAEYRVGAESDHGFNSVEDSSPPNSDSGSQGRVYGSSKDSSDLDSLSDEKVRVGPTRAYINPGYKSDECVESTSSSASDNGPTRTVTENKAKTSSIEETETPSYTDEFMDNCACVDDDHTFILATDADMDFKGEAVKELLDLCNADDRIGAACGRTHPIGKKCSSIVWHQVFEYAKDFWMIKNAQNIIGSVSCCPGCFSLYRASAIYDVIEKYSSPTRTPFSVYVKDTGEDRWMATLMMINGWRMRYSPFADNTTYCPDTFEEYYKQRRRWILSDVANAILVVQNLFRLIRNNECFSFMYVSYLVNMFLNNVITPGTAVVMITAGLELVFEIPYVYTTVPFAMIVYLYAFLCTCTSQRTQGMVTSGLTVLMGSMFSSVAMFGSYKITSGMIDQINGGNFRFQQHYVILLLALSLVYAAVMHPKESYQIVYGFAYLFIFPAMHVLLPIYSIANIIDQSWGTRDSNEAKLPKILCMPSFKKLKRRMKKSKSKNVTKASQNEQMEEDTRAELQEIVSSLATDMSKGDSRAREEHKFWEALTSTRLGVNVNLGLEKTELADGLRKLRNRTLGGFLAINAVWLGILSYFYLGLDTPLSRLNIYGIISGALYGFTLIIQIFGLTASRIEQVFRKAARYVYKGEMPVWVSEREAKTK